MGDFITTCTSDRGKQLILVSESDTRWLVKLPEPLFAEAGPRALCFQGDVEDDQGGEAHYREEGRSFLE